MTRSKISNINIDNFINTNKEDNKFQKLLFKYIDEKEMDDLLRSASYSLPRNNYYDLIIRFCFKEKIYKLTEVNNLLDNYSCKLFNY